jgi:carbon-monoxide dehydrogenase iron sulfur subunit
MTQDPITGIVDRNMENCVGCWMCAMVCPYGVIGSHTEVRVAVKCDRCKSLEVPACVHACPTGALIFATQREFVEMMRKGAAERLAREAKGLVKA